MCATRDVKRSEHSEKLKLEKQLQKYSNSQTSTAKSIPRKTLDYEALMRMAEENSLKEGQKKESPTIGKRENHRRFAITNSSH